MGGIDVEDIVAVVAQELSVVRLLGRLGQDRLVDVHGLPVSLECLVAPAGGGEQQPGPVPGFRLQALRRSQSVLRSFCFTLSRSR